MTMYRIWTRYSHEEWQMFPASYVTEEQAHRAAESYQNAQPVHQFAVLPVGEQPSPDEPFRPGPPEIHVL